MESSPFSTLPAELRTLIFEYALTHLLPIKFHHDNIPNKHPQFDRLKNPQNPTALLQTCRQIHHESAQLFYSLNRFLLPSLFSIVCFDNQLHRHMDAVRTIIIEEIIYPGYFGHYPVRFRNAVRAAAEHARVPETCQVFIRPVFIVNREMYMEEEFEALMEDLQLDVRDVERSLKRSLEKFARRMGEEDDQDKWTELFWAKKLYTQYLERGDEKDRAAMKADRDMARPRDRTRGRKVVGGRLRQSPQSSSLPMDDSPCQPAQV